MIDEARILVRKAVVILLPDVGGQQIIQGRDRPAPGYGFGGFQPFRMLIEHGINDVGERFIARKKSMTPGEQVAFEPTLA